MLKVKELFPDAFKDYNWPDVSYNDIINSFGYEVLLEVEDDDYQGDTRVLLKDGDKYGYLIFGWGSCSGCDALQGCGTTQELQDIYDNLLSGIKWKDSKQELYDYIKNKDWELEWSWHEEETKEFIDKALKLLSEESNATRG